MPPARFIVWVQPRASQTKVVGRHGEAIKVKVAAPPADGAANEELVRFLAQSLEVARSAITVVAGHASRRKTITVEGLTPDQVAARLLP
jgi:uncharacterized protein (TIGR00251 family)